MTAATPHPHTAAEPCPGGCVELDAVDSRFAEGDTRMGRIEASQAAMGAEQSAMRAEVSEVLEILRMGKSFFKAAGYFGAFVKGLVGIVAPLVAIYFAFRNGTKP